MVKPKPPAAIVNQLIALTNQKSDPNNIAALIIDCRDEHKTTLPADSVPPPPPEVLAMAAQAEAEAMAEPELLILGIQDLDVADAVSASDDLLKAIEDLIGHR